MKRTLSVLAMALAINVCQVKGQNQIELINSHEVIEHGVRLNDLGKYDAAIDEFKKVHRDDTNYFSAQYELGFTYSNANNYAKAGEAASKGLKIDNKENDLFYNLLGNTLDHQNKSEEALKVYDEGITKYPNLFLLHYNKALTLYNLERYPEAINELKISLRLNPMHPRSNFLLASINALYGRTIQALLGFNLAVLINNEGDFAKDCIANIEDLLDKKNKKTDKSFIPEKDDIYDFSDLKTLIESNIALNEKYKAKAKMNNTVTKQNQLLFESLVYDPKSDDFFQKQYVKFFTELYKNGYLVPYSYYILADFKNDYVQDWVKKNQASKKKFQEWATNQLAQQMQKKDGKHYYYYDNNIIRSCGTFADKAEKVRSGEWCFYFSNGNPSSKGIFVNDKKDGDWLFYDYKGQLVTKERWVNGIQEGLQTMFFENGKPKVEFTMIKEGIDGPYTLYFANGTIKEKGQYQGGRKTGKVTTYYFDGSLKSEILYKDDKHDGPAMTYYAGGKTETKSNYVNDKYDGEYYEYYENGNIKTSATYKDGKLTGPVAVNYYNGKPEYTGAYNEKGKINGTLKKYYFDGTLNSEETYNDGKLNNECKYYDVDGVLYAVYKYTNDKLIAVKHLDKTGKIISDVQIPKGKTEITTYHPEGAIAGKGSYVDNLRQGKWNYYNRHGVLTSEIDFKDDKKDGDVINYHPNGKISEKYSIKDGETDGYCTSYYPNGKIQAEGWFVKGSRQQNWKKYHPNGKMQSDYFYLNGDFCGTQAEYLYNGNLDYEDEYEEGMFTGKTVYDSVENIWAACKLNHGSGHFELKTPDGKLLEESDFLTGENIDSIRRYFYANQKLQYTAYYLNGKDDGQHTWYYSTGAKWGHVDYKNGKLEGMKVFFTPEGKKDYIQEYSYDNESGPFISYYENGNKRLEINFINGSAEGYKKRFTPDGQELYRMFYRNDELIYITWLESSGKEAKPVMVTADSMLIITRYPSGAKSAEIPMKAGTINGKYKEYFPSGKLRFVADYYYGDYSGVNKTYNQKDQLICEEHYADDLKNGPVINYYENGKIKSEEIYMGGDLNGNCRYYNQSGKLVRTAKYYFNELMEEKLF